MRTATTPTQQFVRRTALRGGEYRKNFRQIDRDAIEVVTSDEACQVTSLMSKVYLRLVDAPSHLSEREGVLRFTGEERDGDWQTAWQQLVAMLGVASATARKALGWMHERGVIGYDAHRNGAGIRVFLNRAAASIGEGAGRASQKNLPAARTSSTALHTSPGDTPFKDTFGVQDDLDLNVNPRAPKNGAGAQPVDQTSPNPVAAPVVNRSVGAAQKGSATATASGRPSDTIHVDEIVWRVRSALEPSLKADARHAAEREHERTREWLDRYGIPKATRVAQKEAYNVLRAHGLMSATAHRAQAGPDVRRSAVSPLAPDLRPRSAEEIEEAAEACVALLEVQSRAIEETLAEISRESGGWLPPEDAARVREAAERLMLEKGVGQSSGIHGRGAASDRGVTPDK